MIVFTAFPYPCPSNKTTDPIAIQARPKMAVAISTAFSRPKNLTTALQAADPLV
jgi:hypothetical protein